MAARHSLDYIIRFSRVDKKNENQPRPPRPPNPPLGDRKKERRLRSENKFRLRGGRKVHAAPRKGEGVIGVGRGRVARGESAEKG